MSRTAQTPEPDDERIAREKAAIEKMRGAQSAMSTALSRIDELERALQTAIAALRTAKGYIGENAHVYNRDCATKSARASIDDQIATIGKVLG